MKKIVIAVLVSIAAAPSFLFFEQPAQAQRSRTCYRAAQRNSAGYHYGSYADGYREGRQNAVNGRRYRRRSAGGEFARGFSDGYYNRAYRPLCNPVT